MVKQKDDELNILYEVIKCQHKLIESSPYGERMLPMQTAHALRNKGVDIKPRRFMKWLRDNGYLYKQGTVNIATQKSIDLGVMEDEVEQCGIYTNHHAYITAEGREYFKGILLKQGVQ